MRAREGARSVAAMRPSLLQSLAVAALVAATAAAPAHAKMGVYGGSTSSDDAIVLRTDEDGTTLQSMVISWRARCSDGAGFPGGGELAAAEAVPGFVPSRSELLMSANAKGRFAGTQLSSADLGEESAAIVVKVTGKLKPLKASGTVAADVTIMNKA